MQNRHPAGFLLAVWTSAAPPRNTSLIEEVDYRINPIILGKIYHSISNCLGNPMRLNLAVKSIVLFELSVLFLLLLTLFESSLSGMSLTAEKAISALLLVLPGVLGIVFGILSLIRKEPKRWIAILGIFLNGLFALFHLSVISFAG